MAREGEGQIVAHPKQLPKKDALARNAAALAPPLPEMFPELPKKDALARNAAALAPLVPERFPEE
jgi:hypothetical protein